MGYLVDYLCGTHPEDLRMRMALDPSVQELRTLEEREGGCVKYSRIAAPGYLSMGIAQRDTVFEQRVQRPDPATALICVSSVLHPSEPPRSGVVRGDNQTFYKVTARGPSECEVDVFASFDPKGAIPHRVLHMFKGKGGAFFVNLRDLLEKRYRDNVPPRHGAPPPHR
eukprot:Hpha_TRINITY_DN2554_c0_g1::TRINITY_DN2554_c0_g1_i1::g.1389::m.1389